MKFNEDSRVKIPSLIHLTRLGYKYLSLKDSVWDLSSNIFEDIFVKAISKINKEKDELKIKNLLDELKISLSNDDLGQSFFEKIINNQGLKVIDFENIENNCFNVVTELTYQKDDDVFRPDITILINGLPLVFIEVKKPNNKEGMYSEKNRINKRFTNKNFKQFANITQFIIFSNNMSYDQDGQNIFQGAFYSSSSYGNLNFNYFREEEDFDLSSLLRSLDDNDENIILKDTNLVSIKNSREFISNKDPQTPTNSILTSLLQKERILFILKYGIAYVKNLKGIEKHIIRYPQLFATKAIQKNIQEKKNKGIIWHTQGSGKTALAYYSLKYLKDYFNKDNKIVKFYFIVDRIDLLDQANKEFKKRGLSVHIINSRDEFAQNIKSNKAVHNDRGDDEIILVNIQKFENQDDVVNINDYNLSIQRIYFLDEVHRSYKPKGSFLTNLHLSDLNSIKIGLTGTPLLGKDTNSRNIFGNYIHKYFYNSSIKDGFTLRLIREEIENQYLEKLQTTLEEIKILKGNLPSEDLFSKRQFVEPMLDYIVQDYLKSKVVFDDNSIGAMVVCDSYKQAEMMSDVFKNKYSDLSNDKIGKSYLVLHDIGTKKERETAIEDFKDGKINFLFVYNMLLTGFDSPRLKKIYFGRKIKSHNLLQALTRVNRPYRNFKFGYVVDFAGIHEEFKKTNQAYFEELQLEVGDELKGYENLFKSDTEINEEIENINQNLFKYDLENLENFSTQISSILDKKELNIILKTLNSARDLYNIIKLSSKSHLLEKINFKNINLMLRETANRISLINEKEKFENEVDTSGLLNLALEDMIFSFQKIKEEELLMSDQLKEARKKTITNLKNNFDTKDLKFISLREELERLFLKKNLSEISQTNMEEIIRKFDLIYDQSRELNRKNELLRAKYDHDQKYARIHKRLMEKNPLTDNESKLYNALKSLKTRTDDELLNNSGVLNNEVYVKKMISRLVIDEFNNKNNFGLDLSKTEIIKNLVSSEYLNEFREKF